MIKIKFRDNGHIENNHENIMNITKKQFASKIVEKVPVIDEIDNIDKMNEIVINDEKEKKLIILTYDLHNIQHNNSSIHKYDGQFRSRKKKYNRNTSVSRRDCWYKKFYKNGTCLL